jgi:uncharacterized protein
MRPRLFAVARFLLFVTLIMLSGKVLDPILARIHFPDRALTWSSLLLNDLLDFCLFAGLAWIMSVVFRESFSSYGLPLLPEAPRRILHGAIWGLSASVVILIPIYILHGCSFHGLAVHGSTFVFYALGWGVAMLVLGLSEEFLFRGYTLTTLAQGIGFWPSAIVLSFLFGLTHFLFKPNEGLIDPVSVALYGLFWSLTIRRTGNLWFAIGFHAASDYADMVLFAEPNTGNNGLPLTGHLLDVRFHGPDWLTGGPRGTEASLLVFLVLAGLFFLFDRVYPSVQKRSAVAISS